jgi:non-specific serine/threonine protein kinase
MWVAGYLAVAQTDGDAAAPLLRASVDVGATSEDPESVAFAIQYLGLCKLFGGDFLGAVEALERAFDMHIRNGERAAAFTLTDLAITFMLTGDTAAASALYERALAIAEDPWTRSHCLWGAGLAAWLQKDVEGAEETEKQALRLIAEVDERSGTALCLHALAWIAASRRNFERAAVLQGAALAVWESIPRRLPAPVRQHDERCERLTRSGLGSETRDRLFNAGRRLDRAAAVAYGLETEDRTAGRAVAAPHTGGLSKRELEVADLVAAGLTDRDIAARLVISQRTAESHVQHILTKLGFRSRTQIAAWVATRAGQTV